MSLQHPPACPAFRDRLVAVAGGEACERALDAHLAECRGCREFLARVRHQVNAFARLPRRTPPRALDGFVVAALQAGARQDRAVRALEVLAPETMPVEGERAVWERARAAALRDVPFGTGRDGAKAPSALDGLVEAELLGRGAEVGTRMSRILARAHAPRALEARVEHVYEVSRRRRARDERRLLLAGAAVLLVALTVAVTLFAARPRAVLAKGDGPVAHVRHDEPRARQVIVERVASPSDLDPMLASTFAGLTGGAPDAIRVTGGKL